MLQVIHTFSADNYRAGMNWTKSTFSPDGEYIAAGSVDGLIYVWNRRTTKLEKTLRSHTYRDATRQRGADARHGAYRAGRRVGLMGRGGSGARSRACRGTRTASRCIVSTRTRPSSSGKRNSCAYCALRTAHAGSREQCPSV